MVRLILPSTRILCLALTGVLLCLSVQAQADDPATAGIVATVDGEPVYYREILADVKKAELFFWEAKGHKPTSTKDQEEIRKNIEEISKPILKNVIEIKIRDHWAEGQEIKVTENDLDDFWETYRMAIEKMQNEDFLNMMKPNYENPKAIIDSANAVYEKGKNKDDIFEVFNQKTLRKWSQASWELTIYELKEKSQRDALKADINLTYEEALQKNREGRRDDVFAWKLQYKIYEVLAKNDQSVKKWLEKNPLKLKHKIENRIARLKTHAPMADKRDRFWLNMYRKADIKILDPKYENILTEIRQDGLD